MPKRIYCYLCGVKLVTTKERNKFEFNWAPGALTRELVKKSLILCKECVSWAARVPEALEAIVAGRIIRDEEKG
jgi:hypothetical protein